MKFGPKSKLGKHRLFCKIKRAQAHFVHLIRKLPLNRVYHPFFFLAHKKIVRWKASARSIQNNVWIKSYVIMNNRRVKRLCQWRARLFLAKLAQKRLVQTYNLLNKFFASSFCLARKFSISVIFHLRCDNRSSAYKKLAIKFAQNCYWKQKYVQQNIYPMICNHSENRPCLSLASPNSANLPHKPRKIFFIF